MSYSENLIHQTPVFDNEPCVSENEVSGSLSLETNDHHHHATKKRKRDVAKEVDKFRQKDRKRIVKAVLDTSNLSPSMESVCLRSKDPPTRKFKSIFRSADDARSTLKAFIQLHKKPAKDCSFPESDSTFPSCNQEKIVHVRHVFDAICDWSYILEWKAVLPRQKRGHVIAQLAASREKIRQAKGQDKTFTDKDRPTEEELATVLPSIEEQQRRVLSQIPSDQTIEWISWEVVVSFATRNTPCASIHTRTF